MRWWIQINHSERWSWCNFWFVGFVGEMWHESSRTIYFHESIVPSFGVCVICVWCIEKCLNVVHVCQEGHWHGWMKKL
jgi:hypothetical protein